MIGNWLRVYRLKRRDPGGDAEEATRERPNASLPAVGNEGRSADVDRALSLCGEDQGREQQRKK